MVADPTFVLMKKTENLLFVEIWMIFVVNPLSLQLKSVIREFVSMVPDSGEYILGIGILVVCPRQKPIKLRLAEYLFYQIHYFQI